MPMMHSIVAGYDFAGIDVLQNALLETLQSGIGRAGAEHRRAKIAIAIGGLLFQDGRWHVSLLDSNGDDRSTDIRINCVKMSATHRLAGKLGAFYSIT